MLNTNLEPGPVNTYSEPEPINANREAGQVNTNWGPGPRPGAKQRAGSREIQIPSSGQSFKSKESTLSTVKKQN